VTRGATPRSDRTARRYVIRGTVQGVGFRPYIYRLAVDLGLGGEVWNGVDHVGVRVEGSADALARFERELPRGIPPAARLESVRGETVPPRGSDTFRIAESRGSAALAVRITADLATCAACLAELRAPEDRRFGYPFLNCTDCGPRYTITRGVPYDRPRTTMAPFTMCRLCAAEYENPASRRFHAQPNACP